MSVGLRQRIGILGNEGNYYVRELRRAASELSIDTEILRFQSLGATLDSLETGAQENSHLAVLVRSMPLGSLEQVIFRMDCLHAWQAAGISIINSPKCLETSIDKWLTLHRLHMAKIPIPKTIACQDRDAALEAFEYLGEDVLVKPLFGGEGRGIIRLQNRDLAWRTFSTLQQLGHVLYVQEFLPHFGYDIRVLVLGEKLFSIRRIAADGNYRTNISQGGWAEPHELTESERAMAIHSASAVGGEIVGVDLLPTRDGRLVVLEINAVPGWKAVAQTLDIDIAQLVMFYASQQSRPTQTPPPIPQSREKELEGEGSSPCFEIGSLP